MSSNNSQPMSFGSRVAAEVRAELARRRISVNRMDALCGKPRGWAQRRLQEESVVLDLADLELIATALGVDVHRLLTVPYLRRLDQPTFTYVAGRPVRAA